MSEQEVGTPGWSGILSPTNIDVVADAIDRLFGAPKTFSSLYWGEWTRGVIPDAHHTLSSIHVGGHICRLLLITGTSWVIHEGARLSFETWGMLVEWQHPGDLEDFFFFCWVLEEEVE